MSDGAEIAYSLVGGSHVASPAIDGNDAVYGGVAPGVDELFSVSQGLVMQWEIVRAAGDFQSLPQELSWDIALPAGYRGQMTAGNLVVLNGRGAEVARIGFDRAVLPDGRELHLAPTFDAVTSRVSVSVPVGEFLAGGQRDCDRSVFSNGVDVHW